MKLLPNLMLMKIFDCMDVINWYLFQIQVKFMRAVSGTLRN